ncbi:HAD family hydrolase [Variovorax sp. J22R24]|uniref:HAD family hydrolase n=1 Tax=Variovorax gracilis TaxID=3053502 RepID=UPI002576C088|nr:HAD family hydrolase [Variovorax sp. J22R24]MDM0103495.1 HAD family hydrolase [Variovorax sp. J22R24]
MGSGRLALFDLDLTLIPFDSGMAWTQFLIGRGILPAEAEPRYLAYCHEYIAGTLDIHAMHRTNMRPLLPYSRATLAQWQHDFEAEMAPRMPAWSLALVKRHQESGDLCAIVTATTELISEPIARLFGIDHLLATRPATVDGLAGAPFTGEIDGEPCYRQHKVTRVNAWLASRLQGSGRSLAEFEQSWFYSDAMGDLPLLSAVSHPVVVCPDERLHAHALRSGWPILYPA